MVSRYLREFNDYTDANLTTIAMFSLHIMIVLPAIEKLQAVHLTLSTLHSTTQNTLEDSQAEVLPEYMPFLNSSCLQFSDLDISMRCNLTVPKRRGLEL